MAIVDGSLAAAAAAGAIYGYIYVSRCNSAMELAASSPEALEANRYAPPTLNPVPPAAPEPIPTSPLLGFATAQPGGKHLAVLEFQGKNLDQDILMAFSDAVRGGALQGLEGRGVAVMTRENTLVLLKNIGKQECTGGDCEVETARNIGADYVISGRVVRVEGTYVVTLKLHETQGGNLVASDTVEAGSQVELMRALTEHARKLVTNSTGARPTRR